MYIGPLLCVVYKVTFAETTSHNPLRHALTRKRYAYALFAIVFPFSCGVPAGVAPAAAWWPPATVRRPRQPPATARLPQRLLACFHAIVRNSKVSFLIRRLCFLKITRPVSTKSFVMLYRFWQFVTVIVQFIGIFKSALRSIYRSQFLRISISLHVFFLPNPFIIIMFL